MITFKRALEIHSILIDSFGGTLGVRDHSLLEALLNRPYQTIDRSEVYPTIIEKAAALFEGIVINHPFIDGNKRTGYVFARLTIMKGQYDIVAGLEEKYNFIIKTSSGELEFNHISRWLEEHCKRQ